MAPSEVSVGGSGDAGIDAAAARDDARALGIMIAVVTGCGLALLAVVFWQYGWHSVRAGSSVALLAFYGLLADMLRRGKTQAAKIGLIWTLCLVPLGFSLVHAGLATPALTVVPLAATLAGWMLGWRHGLAMALVALGVSAGEYAMHRQGHQFPLVPTQESYLILQATLICIGVTIGITSANTYRRQYRRIVELSQTLEERVAQRTAELKRMQEELVRVETLASLGHMVAGISHELNTPIGNALTVATSAWANCARWSPNAPCGARRWRKSARRRAA